MPRGQKLRVRFVLATLSFQEVAALYERGDQIVVSGFGGRTAVLRVWEDRGRGVLAASEAGFALLSRGEEAALVGYPKADVKGRATVGSSSEPPPPDEQSPADAPA